MRIMRKQECFKVYQAIQFGVNRQFLGSVGPIVIVLRCLVGEDGFDGQAGRESWSS